VAGALGLAGTAALAAVDAVAPLPGQTVLISGATGGVGAFAVQLAAASGAYVISTVRPGEDDDALLRDLGIHATVDYTGDVPAAVTALRPAGIHAVVHLAGDRTTSWSRPAQPTYWSTTPGSAWFGPTADPGVATFDRLIAANVPAASFPSGR